MDPWQVSGVPLFLFFFVPGFVSMKVYDLLIAGERRDFSKAVLEAMAYSAVNFAALSWLIILAHSASFFRDWRIAYYAVIFLVLFVAPIVWPVLYLSFSRFSPVARYVVHPIQSPWDYIFGKRDPFWVIVHLRDCRRIGGKYGTASFASSYPSGESLYMEELWELDKKGRFVKPVHGSKGMVIFGKEVVGVEFFEWKVSPLRRER
jgi:hypothetical protein